MWDHIICVFVCIHIHIHIYSTNYYLFMKKEGNSAACDNMDGLDYSKWSESDREKEIPYDIYMWNLQKID